jgi:WhiB family redox-sensing transcriptional regulator
VTRRWITHSRLSPEASARAMAAFELVTSGEREWYSDAACSSASADLFFPETRSEVAAHLTEAVQICETCPVAVECLSTALREGHNFGVWGGLTATDRRRLYFWSGLARSASPPRHPLRADREEKQDLRRAGMDDR